MDQAQQNGKGKSATTSISESSNAGTFAAIVPHDNAGESTEVDIVAVPAIGAHPKRTWIPYLLQRPKVRTKPLTTESLPSPSAKTRGHGSSLSRKTRASSEEPRTPQDIDNDGRDTSHGPWLTTDLREDIPEARSLLYDHGGLQEGDTLEGLAQRLLEALSHLQRESAASQALHSKSRPIFFICHSTGGLVAKKALILANRPESSGSHANIACNTYGMTFIATPHQGSAYLSSKEFRPSVHEVMHLRVNVPDSLQRQLEFGCDELCRMAEGFKRHSTDLRIYTYYETKDSDLAFTPANDDIPRSYHVPIVSVASAIMDLEHEFESPLSSDHVGCATFEDDDDAQNEFVTELKDAVNAAATLSKIKNYDVDLEDEVEVEVNGFFEDSTSSVKLWTARPSLADLLQDGPNALLLARLRRSKEPSKAPLTRKDTPYVTKQEVRAEITSKLQEVKKYLKPQSKKILTPRPPLVKSASESEPALEAGRGHNHEQEVPTDKAIQTAQDGVPAASIRFAEQEHPESDRRRTIAPNDPGPQLPAMDRLKLTWVHIPYTHSGWVTCVLDRISKERRCQSSDFLKDEHWASNHNRGRHAAPHAKFVKSSFVDPSPSVGSVLQRSNESFATYLQYLHWDTYRQLLERRIVIRHRMKQGRVRPFRQLIKEHQSVEIKMIWKYLGAEPPFHCRRTLDQFGYPNLRSCEARDDDQMLWKRTRPKATASRKASKTSKPAAQDKYDLESTKEPHKAARDLSSKFQKEISDNALQSALEESRARAQEGNVLMVDQLWLWVLDKQTIVTFFPKKEPLFSEGKLYQQGDLHNDIYNEVNSGLQSVPDAQTFAALIVERAVTILLERTAHRHLEVLRIYEESLSILIERMTRSYKSFRKEGFSVRPDAYYRKQNGEPMTTGEKQARDMDMERQSKEDFSSLLELRDISDELHTIKKLFKEQRDTLFAMARYYRGEGKSEAPLPAQSLLVYIQEIRKVSKAENHDTDGLQHLEATARSLDSFETSVSEMIESAENTEKAYSSLLDIKQKQANVDESRMARSRMDATAAQGRSIMVFTTFTIIFLPLSFFTSLFGMNVREWISPGQPPPLHRVAEFIGPISVAVILIALTLAFSVSVRSIAFIARKIVLGVAQDLYHVIYRPLRPAFGPFYALYKISPVSGLLEWISNRYVRQNVQVYGKDHNIWNEYAQPLHKSPREMASQDDREPSWRRRSFLHKVKEMKGEKAGDLERGRGSAYDSSPGI